VIPRLAAGRRGREPADCPGERCWSQAPSSWILDGTVIAPAAPHIAEDLGVPAVAINVAITGYVLTLAVLIPISGWLADRYGARRVFMTAVAIFTVASIGCAAAVSLPMLISTRVLQGVGGALMLPVGRLVVLRSTAKTDLVRAIAY
jgi:MFS family permease